MLGRSSSNVSGSRSPRGDRRMTKAIRKVTFKDNVAFDSQRSGISEHSSRSEADNASQGDITNEDWVLRIKDRERS